MAGRRTGERHEKNISTKGSQACSQARISQENVQQNGKSDSSLTPDQRQKEAVSLIAPLSKRSDFARLQELGVSARSGCLKVRYVAKSEPCEHGASVLGSPKPDSSEQANPAQIRVGYAISKKIGHSPRRNRVKRQLRAIVSEAAKGSKMPAGDYLLSVIPPANADFQQLSDDLDRALAKLNAKMAEQKDSGASKSPRMLSKPSRKPEREVRTT